MTHVALITGASRGIGRATAERLARQHHRVVGLARRKPTNGFPGRFCEVDLGDGKATEAVLHELVKEEPFDMLINNVGMVHSTSLGLISSSELTEAVEMNLRPALQAAQALVPIMKRGKWGRIVNISSLTVLGARNRVSYAAMKAAMISFTRSWALELAIDGITVNCIAPGPTESELFRANNPIGSEAEQRLLAATPLGRIAQPEEIAAGICYFLSEEAGIVTGQTLFIDGGMSIGRSMI